jgi:pimeloyl-ACP methyl ester carboxylesterase
MEETLPAGRRHSTGRNRSDAARRGRALRALGITVLLLVAATLIAAAWALTYVRQAQAAYNVLEYRLEGWWTERIGELDLAPGPTGSISGTVRDQAGQPLEGAVVVVSDRYGRTGTARSDADGHYTLEGVPTGWVVPTAARHGYEDAVYGRGPWPMPRAVRVRAGRTRSGVDWEMVRLEVPHSSFYVQWGEQAEVFDDYPWPVHGTRTEVTIVRDGYPVECYVYEPPLAVGKGRALPGLVAVYPGPPLNWEPASTAFLAQGYVVLGISPTSIRDLDAYADTEDLRVVMELFAQGALSDRLDVERIAALGGSFSSVALVRALRYGPNVRAVVMLGGLADPYMLRRDAYEGGYTGYEINENMEFAMWSLGRPDRMPRMYTENAAVFHVEGLPPLCLVHGTGDVVVPYNQSERFAAALARAGQPYELHIYETGHYPGIHEPDAATEAMYQQMVLFLARELELESVAPAGGVLAR